MARRTTWLIDMGDGTWSVCCMACRLALYRGSKAGADRAAAQPLLRTRRPPRPPAPVGLTRGPPRAPVRRRDPGPALDGRAAHRQPPSHRHGGLDAPPRPPPRPDPPTR